MPMLKENNTDIICENSKEKTESNDNIDEPLKGLNYVDLYVIGRLWIAAMRAVLVGANLCIIPKVSAAKPEEIPKKPPSMKYKDLSLYQSPHYEYRQYHTDKEKCPEANTKLLHNYLLPYVTSFRKEVQQDYKDSKEELNALCKYVCNNINTTKRDFLKYMRDPENKALRQGVVATGAFSGYCFGYKRGIPTRLFYTGVGALATGALCFPNESDRVFRDFSYHVGKTAISAYNAFCGREFSMRERVPCKDELPPPLNSRRREQCFKK